MMIDISSSRSWPEAAGPGPSGGEPCVLRLQSVVRVWGVLAGLALALTRVCDHDQRHWLWPLLLLLDGGHGRASHVA